MEVKLSVFELHWVGVIVLSHPLCQQSVQDFSMRYRNFKMFLLFAIEKFIDQLETKMTSIDPSIVR